MGEAASSTPGLADACTQPAGHGVGPGVYGAGGQDGCRCVPVLQGKAACASSQCWRGWGACRRSVPSCALLPPRAPSTTWRAGRAASGVAIWPLALAVDATNVTRRSQFALARPRSPVPLWGDDHGGQVFDATAGGKEFAIKYLATYVNQTRASGAFHSFFWFVGRFGARTGLWRSRQK